MIHAHDFGLSSEVSAVRLICVEGDILLLHGARESWKRLLKLVGLGQDPQAELVVVDRGNLAAAGLNGLDGRFRSPRDLNRNRCLEVGLSVAQKLDAVLNVVDAARVEQMLHSDGLCGVQTSRFDPELQAIQVQRLEILVLGVLESTLGEAVDQTGLTSLETRLGLSTVTGASLLTLVTTGSSVTLSGTLTTTHTKAL